MAMKHVSDREVLLAYAQSWCEQVVTGDGRWPYDILAEWTGQPGKVCWRCVERAADRGLLGWGVSLRTGWIEPRGYNLLGVPAPSNVYAGDVAAPGGREKMDLLKRLLAEAGRPFDLVPPEPVGVADWVERERPLFGAGDSGPLRLSAFQRAMMEALGDVPVRRVFFRPPPPTDPWVLMAALALTQSVAGPDQAASKDTV